MEPRPKFSPDSAWLRRAILRRVQWRGQPATRSHRNLPRSAHAPPPKHNVKHRKNRPAGVCTTNAGVEATTSAKKPNSVCCQGFLRTMDVGLMNTKPVRTPRDTQRFATAYPCRKKILRTAPRRRGDRSSSGGSGRPSRRWRASDSSSNNSRRASDSRRRTSRRWRGFDLDPRRRRCRWPRAVEHHTKK